MKAIRSVSLWGTALVLTPPMATIAAVSALSGDKSGKVWWKASQVWASGLLKVAGVEDVMVEGYPKDLLQQPAILMSNHQSHLDPPALIMASSWPVGFLTKQELKWIPFFGWSLEATGHIFIDRKNKARAFESIERAASLIREGRRILVFPEGTRSQDGTIHSFKKGGFVLAIKSGVPIIPVGIAGTSAIFPPQNRYVQRKGKVSIVFGDPIETAQHDLDHKEALMDEVKDAIQSLYQRAQERLPSSI